MRYVAFDLESNGLLLEATTIHMVIITDLETMETRGYTNAFLPDWTGLQLPSGTVSQGLDILANASLLVTFNGWGFDLLLLEKLYPEWTYSGYHLDLKTHGATVRPYDKLLGLDKKLVAAGKMQPRMIGSESLRAWAIRAGREQKGEYTGSWEKLNREMWAYGLQDGTVTADVYHWMMRPSLRVTWQAMWIEQEVGRIIGRMQANGWRVDIPYLHELDIKLGDEVSKAKTTMAETFGDWYRLDRTKAKSLLFRSPRGGYKVFEKAAVPRDLDEAEAYLRWPVQVPKKTMTRQKRQYTEGVPYSPVELHTFNPNSRNDVYLGLHKRYDWEPTKRTNTGAPKVSEETLAELEWPEAKAAHRYFLLSKISGYVSSWLQKEKGGRLYGTINSNRANTRRMTHQNPNLANVPASGSLYGEECRGAFLADEGWVLVGADAEQLELRCLASRLAPFDGGKYADEVVHGDVHTLHISAAATVDRTTVTKPIRDGGKTVTYAWIYGAGDAKLAASYRAIQGLPKRTGKAIRAGYETGITGVAALLESLKKMLRMRQSIYALDGSNLYSRSAHSLLNLALQSDGALIMKVALIFADELLYAQGLREGKDYKWVGAIHDEYQATAKQEYGDTVGRAMVGGIRKAGEWFGFAVPTDGQYSIGINWNETH